MIINKPHLGIKVAEKKPSIPFDSGIVRKYASSTILKPCLSQNFATYKMFSSGSTLHVAYTILEFSFLRKCKLSSRISSWTFLSSSNFSKLNFHLRSGLRRRTPEPVQGTSSKTQSHLLCNSFLNRTLSWWNWAFCTPARRSRYLAYTSTLFLMSCK